MDNHGNIKSRATDNTASRDIKVSRKYIKEMKNYNIISNQYYNNHADKHKLDTAYQWKNAVFKFQNRCSYNPITTKYSSPELEKVLSELVILLSFKTC